MGDPATTTGWGVVQQSRAREELREEPLAVDQLYGKVVLQLFYMCCSTILHCSSLCRDPWCCQECSSRTLPCHSTGLAYHTIPYHNILKPCNPMTMSKRPSYHLTILPPYHLTTLSYPGVRPAPTALTWPPRLLWRPPSLQLQLRSHLPHLPHQILLPPCLSLLTSALFSETVASPAVKTVHSAR